MPPKQNLVICFYYKPGSDPLARVRGNIFNFDDKPTIYLPKKL